MAKNDRGELCAFLEAGFQSYAAELKDIAGAVFSGGMGLLMLNFTVPVLIGQLIGATIFSDSTPHEPIPEQPTTQEPNDDKLRIEKYAEDFIICCDAVPRADLVGFVCNAIDELMNKLFWDRHYKKGAFEQLVRKFDLDLGKEYAEKLSHLDDYQEGESLDFPSVRQDGKTFRPRKHFREFIRDAEQTEEVVRQLHLLIGNKANSEALRVITEAMWVGVIDRPTSTAIKQEFPSVTCSAQAISKYLTEPKPTRQADIDRIKAKFGLS